MRASIQKLGIAGAGLALLLSACSGSTGTAAPDGDFGEAPDSLAFSTPGACAGDIVVGLDANLAEGFVETSGPYPVNVPAGTYHIQMESWADLDDPVEDNERWFFTTDSGYTSPLIADPGDRHVIRQTFNDQVVAGDASSITISHMLPGDEGSNSVVAKCVSFTLVPPPETTTSTTSTTTPTTTTTTTTEVPTTQTETTEPEDDGRGEVGQSNVINPPTTAATTVAPPPPPTTAAVAPPTTRPSQVGNAGNQNEPDTLALTGPSDLAASLALTGAALLTAGFAALRASRHTES